MKITLANSSPLLKPDFVFGVATASFQIEGAADSREACIWDTFCAQPGRIKDGSNGLVACDHIARWRDDVELIAALGVDAYRFSVSWGRVINADGSINQAGLNFYLQLLDALNDRNIKAFVTLYHWDLPQYLQDQGIQYVVECGPGTVLSNLAKRLPNIEKAFAIDSKARMEDALNAVLVAEGKIA